MVLLIILLGTILTLITINLLKIKEQSNQILLYIFVVLTLFVVNYLVRECKIRPTTQAITTPISTSAAITPLQKKEIEELKKEIDKSIYTPDKIIPNSVYNQDDCTNDGSCIIPPDKANTFGYIDDKLDKGPKIDSSITQYVDKCIKCGRPLSLLNNPVTEKFMSDCDCNLCNDMYVKREALNKMCIHCKVGIMLENRCSNIKNIPTQYYPQ